MPVKSKLKWPQKIVIVDEDKSNLLYLKGLLAGVKDETQILAVCSPQETLKLLDENDVSLIILDEFLPTLNGEELASIIHSKPENKFTPIMLLADCSDSESKLVKRYQSGVIDILHNPVNPEILRAKTRIFLELDFQRRLINEQSLELQETLKRLQHYVQHDQLTQLFNREQITNILVRLMANSRRTGKKISLLFLDLDHFKNVNDCLGHDIGDLLLKSVAERIRSVVRESDFVARLGGDEFAVLLTELDRPDAAGEVAHKLLQKIILPHHIRQHEVLVSCSVGIAHYDSGDCSAQQLLKSADAAMYLAKRKGRNQYAFFSESLEKQAQQRIKIANRLNYAIKNDELSIDYQPQLLANGGELVGFEALLRWQCDGNWMSPSEFIPIAEESGMIPQLGEWILLNGCRDFQRWRENELIHHKVKLAVNISNRQLQAGDFMSILQNTLDETGIPPSCLELELTESTVMDDPNSTTALFNEVHSLGIEIAVDDFGTGYSSLSYLRQLPLDALKIDRSFVSHIANNTNDEAIVKAIINLSHTLGLKVIAEGVETEEQSLFLRANDCDFLQGYHFAKPIRRDEVEAYLTSNNRAQLVS